MNYDTIAINGRSIQGIKVVSVTSPFVEGWTEAEVREHIRTSPTFTITLPAAKTMHRFLAGLHLPKRLRATWSTDIETVGVPASPGQRNHTRQRCSGRRGIGRRGRRLPIWRAARVPVQAMVQWGDGAWQPATIVRHQDQAVGDRCRR